jgi:Tn3 transposase DDE domain
MAKALERVDEISAFRLGGVKLDKVPPNQLATMARVGMGSKAPILERTPEPKRTALLTSVVRHLEASAIDDALDLFSVLILLGTAFAEYGRIAKTLHLLRVVNPVDDTYRRQMNRQLTVQESRHKLARDICHGKRGQIMQAYRTGQED